MKIKPVARYYLKEAMAHTLKLIGVVFILKFALRKSSKYLILNYHNFSKYNNYRIKRGGIIERGYCKNFEKQLQFLSRHFNYLYPEEFFVGKPKKGLSLLITFDDGYKDNYDIAFPILKQYQAKAVFFVVTSIIGTKKWLLHDKLRLLVTENVLSEDVIENHLKRMNKGQILPEDIADMANENFSSMNRKTIMMNWSDLKEMRKQGFKIMPHSTDHSIVSSLGKQGQENEISGAIKKVRSKLDINPEYFAYPNGLYNSTTLQVAASNGIKYGFTTNPGINRKDEKRLELKRIGVNASDSMPVLVLKLLITALK